MPRWRRKFIRSTIILALTYLTILGFLTFFETNFIFAPQSLGPKTPEEVKLEHFHSKLLVHDGLPSIRYWENDAAKNAPTVLYFHGNGHGLWFRNHRNTLAFLDQQKLHVIAMEYPGFPDAEGTPSEPLVIAQAVALYDDAAKHTHPFIWGYSLGTGVAVQLAEQRTPSALILEAPFTSAADPAHELFPFLPVYRVMRNQLLSREHIGNVHAPLLIIHGTSDFIVPIHHGRDLFARANEPKEFRSYEGYGHMDLINSGAYADAVEFIGNHREK